MDVVYLNLGFFGIELNKVMNSDIKFFLLIFIMMMIYVCLVLVLLWLKCNNIVNRMNLGIVGVIILVLGIGVVFGLVSGVGVKFINIVGVMFFLIIGKYFKNLD